MLELVLDLPVRNKNILFKDQVDDLGFVEMIISSISLFGVFFK